MYCKGLKHGTYLNYMQNIMYMVFNKKWRQTARRNNNMRYIFLYSYLGILNITYIGHI